MRVPDVIIFGCGNTLLGDDGFGPAVIAALDDGHILPENIETMDIGTSIREYLFDYLLAPEIRPKKIIIIDSIQTSDRLPGDVFLLDLQQIPLNKQHDYSLHQHPTTNMLLELEQQADIEILVIVAKVNSKNEEIGGMLSQEIQAAIPKACDLVLKQLRG